MASNYTGNPAGVQSPDTGFAAGHAPVLSVPAGTDGLSIESITQWAKVNADYLAAYAKLLNATLPVTTSVLPQLRLLDAAGNGRFVFDHNGLPTGGRVCVVNENWLRVPGASSQWDNVLGTGASIAIQDPTASYNAPFLLFTPSSTAAATAYALAYTQRLILANTAGMTFVLEFDVGLNAAAVGTASLTSWFFGLDAGVDPGGVDVSLAGLYKKHNSANWQFLCGNGALQNVTASSPLTAPTSGANPVDRVKIEIQGSGSPYAAYQVRFYVNENAIGTVTSANLPGATALRLLMGSFNEGGAPVGSPRAYLGPLVGTWNRYTSGPNL